MKIVVKIEKGSDPNVITVSKGVLPKVEVELSGDQLELSLYQDEIKQLLKST